MGQDATFRLFGGTSSKGEMPIRSLEDWLEAAPPKGGRAQWKPLRSAYELARAWCATGEAVPPRDFAEMLAQHPLLEGLELLEGWAEYKTDLRGENRGPRVHDLLVVGRCHVGLVLIGVEAKADEAFDRPLQERWDEVQRTLEKGGRTNWPDRLSRLAPALLGEPAESVTGVLNPAIADVPYQLLSALAGTLIEAEDREAAVAVLVVHVFSSSATRGDLLTRNRDAFASFVSRMTGIDPRDVVDGELYGPLSVPGGADTRIPSHIPVLIGELTTEIPPSVR